MSSGVRAILYDAQNAFRVVRRDLPFFLFASTIVGVGVGASASVYSVVRPLLLKPLPFEQPQRLLRIANGGGEESTGSSPLLLRDFRDLSRSFEAITDTTLASTFRATPSLAPEKPERQVGVGVARDFLGVLGVEPLLGRSFTVEDAVFGGSRTAILTHGFWKRRFGADPCLGNLGGHRHRIRSGGRRTAAHLRLCVDLHAALASPSCGPGQQRKKRAGTSSPAIPTRTGVSVTRCPSP